MDGLLVVIEDLRGAADVRDNVGILYLVRQLVNLEDGGAKRASLESSLDEGLIATLEGNVHRGTLLTMLSEVIEGLRGRTIEQGEGGRRGEHLGQAELLKLGQGHRREILVRHGGHHCAILLMSEVARLITLDGSVGRWWERPGSSSHRVSGEVVVSRKGGIRLLKS